MRVLPLYPDPAAPSVSGGLALPVQLADRLDVDPACSRCPLAARARNPCIPGEGEPGGVLLVGERPGAREDACRRPFAGDSGAYLRKVVRRWWGGPVALDNALRCFSGRDEVGVEHVEACRPYLARTIEEARPTRIVALGAVAWEALTGRGGAPLAMRRAFAWAGDVPVFAAINPAAALRNRFVAEWFEQDLRWALTTPAPPFPGPAGLTYGDVLTPSDSEEAAEALRAAGRVSIDAETSGRQHEPEFRVISVAIAACGGSPAFVWGPEQLLDQGIAGPLRALLADPSVTKVGSNLKSDLSFLRGEFGVRGELGDVRLWRKLLDPEASGALGDMAELVGMGGHKDEMMAALAAAESRARPRGRKQQPLLGLGLSDLVPAWSPPDLEERLRAGMSIKSVSYGLVPRSVLTRYNARDAVATARLDALLWPQLREREGLLPVWEKIVRPMSAAISRVETWGVPVSLRALDLFSAHLGSRLTDLRRRLDGYGKDFNPASSRQVAGLLFGKLGLTPPPGTETEAGNQSTAEEVLLSLSKHQVVQDILEHRGLVKLKGTYADGMRAHVSSDGRIHPSILPDGARSGRTSCLDPNLQNIPRADDSPEGKMARDVFAARPGWLLLQVDFKQLEYRIAAMLSRDPVMISLVRSGVDFHLGTAQVIAPLMRWEKIEKPQRTMAKTVNFALLYGMADSTLAARLGISAREAERVRSAVLGKFGAFAEWSRERVREARTFGTCRTWWAGRPARWRSLWRIADHDGDARVTAEHGAVNSVVQGTSADYCNASMSGVVDWIEEDRVPAELVLAIHDALLLHVREDVVEEAAWQVRRIMLSHDSGDVPLDVDIEVGPAWGSLRKIVVP